MTSRLIKVIFNLVKKQYFLVPIRFEACTLQIFCYLLSYIPV